MAHEDQLWQRAQRLLEQGEKVVLCTLVASHGSTPREVGAHMLYTSRGVVAGTVGGGCGEAEVLIRARKVFAGHMSQALVNVDLAGDLDQSETQACGGTMDVFVAPLASTQLSTIEQLAQAEAKRERIVFAICLNENGDEGAQVQLVDGEPDQALPQVVVEASRLDGARFVTNEDQQWFVQSVGTQEALILVGSGHVAQPLSHMAALLGYQVTIVDDRAAYANSENFPEASTIRVGNHAEELKALPIDEYSSIVIVTRGHQYDEAALRQALNTPARYIGMIGSKRRALATLKRLIDDGTDSESCEAVHTPIGLDIGAQTPEEIALAILAEIVARRRGGSGSPLRELRPKGRP